MAKAIDDAITTMIANLPEKTGKTLEEWVAIATSEGKSKHDEIVAVSKSDHGLTHGYANLVARRTLEAGSDEPGGADDLVSTQYAGVKAALKPPYEAVIAAAHSPHPTWRSTRRRRM